MLAELLIPIFAQLLGLFGVMLVLLMYLISLPLWLMSRSPDLPIWLLPLNLALWGFVVGAIFGGFKPAKTMSGSEGSDSGI